MDVQLVMFRADGVRKDLRIKGESATIGRSSGCTFRIGLADISRRHCQLLKKGDHLIVRDLGSSNGTFLNDKRVLQSDVKAGDKLRVGPVVMVIVIDGVPASVEPVRTHIDAKKKIVEKSAGSSASGSAITLGGNAGDSGSGTDLLALMDDKKGGSSVPIGDGDEEVDELVQQIDRLSLNPDKN